MAGLGLLWRLWPATMPGLLPVLVVVGLSGLLDGGPSWSLAEDVLFTSLGWSSLALLYALCVYATLALRARGTGLPVTVDALAATQERAFPAAEAERLRAALAGSGRAYDVTGAGESWDFRWRPFRGRRTVAGSLTVDRTSGEARVLLRADERPRGLPGLRGAGAFVALCQVTRLRRTG
ncbi:hypothetical protein [Streptomyces sp. NRRL S-1022]|uniref:hypothetical protein n=1 Tax=Streptomyces sp. NRRL S-1022 TaxID=1463880 RepID=UPI0004BE63EC|nr:hypothetical protein [Streptomyces sp. NRRL S-1022]